jgi:hypothetical protein
MLLESEPQATLGRAIPRAKQMAEVLLIFWKNLPSGLQRLCRFASMKLLTGNQ